ncbi:MAG: glycosyl hydrolase [Burkholderiaceae bacterium]
MQGTILVGTAGQGILRSVDDGATWHRLGLKEAIEFDGTVRTLAVDPRDPSRILVGADVGICLSEDGGAHFRRLDSVMNGMTVWSIAIDPNDPATMFAGTGAPSRCCVYRSKDGGETWQAVVPVFPEFCAGVNRPRLLSIAIDPGDSDDVWFGVEEGGAYRSRDGGESWQRLDGPDAAIRNSDIHGVAVMRDAAGSKTILVLTVNAVYRSTDNGETWSGKLSRERFDDMYYTRCVLPLADDPNTMLIAIGDGTPGTRSMLYRSEDGGQKFHATVLHQPPNSTFWSIASHPSDPQLLFAGTKYGHLYRSIDGGRQWHREWREFSEITSVAFTPHVAPVTAHARTVGQASDVRP